jgi:hypothetical protein
MANPAQYRQQASEDFSKARGRAFLSKMYHLLNADRDRLLSFKDVKDIIKPRSETYKGMQVVELDKIVGSEGRYHDFNKYFLPRGEHLRYRWERVDVAHLSDIILPPIQLYEIGGVYFVRDGNHRVSVARAQDGFAIDAEVISLSSEIDIKPDMTPDDLRMAVIEHEKKLFYRDSNFLALTNYAELNFSSPGRYDVIMDHILVHKYYLNEQNQEEISLEQAIESWFTSVYQPIVSVIEEEKILSRFPKRTSGDLYLWIVTHWDFLKKKYGIHYSIADAAKDFSLKYGRDSANFFLELLAKLLNLFRKK